MAHDTSDTEAPVGQRLRALRRARRLTLRAVAGNAGISEGYLSQVERGTAANPSIATLQQISAALGLKMADLFASDYTSGPRVLRAGEAPSLVFGVLGRKFRLTPGPQHHLEVFLGEFEAGGSTGERPYTHGDSEEFLLVIEGHVELDLADERFALGPGDSIRYSSAVPHRLAEVADAAARVLWVISPPSY